MSAHARSTRLGYVLALAAASMWALNGSLARFLLDDGVGALRLAQLRSLLSWIVLLAVLSSTRPALLRVRRADVPRLAFLGIVGLAGVHATYFFAIDRLEIGVALTIEYLGPLLILLWLRLAHGRRLGRGLWGAAALSLAGCFLVVRAYHVSGLDWVGLAAAFGAAITFAIYLVGSERAGRRYSPVTTLVWAFGFATLFWAVVQPLWDFPLDRFDSVGNVGLGLGVAVVGTLLPFGCMVAAVRHIPASRAAVVATLEPVLAAVFAWAIHGQGLSAVQIAGGGLVVAAVVWVQLQRIAREAEQAPEHPSIRRRRAVAARA
ncbi:MAG: EamA family transporter [Actinobacteria bacterium]|nr:MAG: EamA family transporter [Actinomycetota bacterium]